MFNLFKKKETEQGSKAAFWVLLVASVVALGAAFVLSLEEIHLLKDPSASLSCSFNVVLNCASVMQTWQASVFFGIPNMLIGLMAFPVIVTVAVAALFGGVQFKRGFLLAMNIGVLLGTLFAYWLFFNSVYVIQVLCPWCLVVTFTCTLMLAAATHIALKANAYGLNKERNEKVQKYLKSGFHQLIVASWIVVMIVLVFLQFGTALFGV